MVLVMGTHTLRIVFYGYAWGNVINNTGDKIFVRGKIFGTVTYFVVNLVRKLCQSCDLDSKTRCLANKGPFIQRPDAP